jgi:hypothetical protein
MDNSEGKLVWDIIMGFVVACMILWLFFGWR